MASPYEYTPRRRLLAQLAMIVLLGVMLGTAQLLAWYRNKQDVLELDVIELESVDSGAGVVRLPFPRGWRLERNRFSYVASDPENAASVTRARLVKISLIPQETTRSLEEELATYAAGASLTDKRSRTVADRRGVAAVVRRSDLRQEIAVAMTVIHGESLHLLIRVEVVEEGKPLSRQDFGLLDDICSEMRVSEKLLN